MPHGPHRSVLQSFASALTASAAAACLMFTLGCQQQRVESDLTQQPAAKDAAKDVTQASDELSGWPALKAKYLAASRREHDHRISEWKTVEHWNFDDNQMPAQFVPIDGKWDIHNGMLRAYDGEKDRNRTIKIAPCQWPSFRMTFDAILTPREGYASDRICDLGIRLNADPDTGSFAKGYVAILAHYANQDAVIYRLNAPFVRTEFTPIEPGKRHRIMIEVVKPHIRVWVDDTILLEAWERAGLRNRDMSDFMEMDPTKNIVLHTYDTNLQIDNLTISVPEEPKPAP